MSAKEDILVKIACGYDNSRKLTDATQYSQEHIRRVVSTLAGDGVIVIIREPRGHTYAITEDLVWHAVMDASTCPACRALHGKSIHELGVVPPLHGPTDPFGRDPCRCTIRHAGDV